MAPELNDHTVAMVARCLGRLGAQASPGLLAALETRAAALATAGEFNERNITMLLLGFHQLRAAPSAVLVGALELRAAALAHRFAPTSIGNVLWALTKMGVRPGPTLLDALEARAEDTAGSFGNPELVALVWALGELAKSGDGWRPAPGLLAALDARAAAIAPGFQPSELTLVRALDEIRRPPTPLAAHADPPSADTSSLCADYVGVRDCGTRAQLSVREERRVARGGDSRRAGGAARGPALAGASTLLPPLLPPFLPPRFALSPDESPEANRDQRPASPAASPSGSRAHAQRARADRGGGARVGHGGPGARRAEHVLARDGAPRHPARAQQRAGRTAGHGRAICPPRARRAAAGARARAQKRRAFANRRDIVFFELPCDCAPGGRPLTCEECPHGALPLRGRLWIRWRRWGTHLRRRLSVGKCGAPPGGR
jgi:hypothetical protein